MYQSIVNVDISLNTQAVSRAGFGVPLFAASHRYFFEKVRAYTSITEVANDIPTDSTTYKAMQAYFSQSPAPSVVKVGRIDADVTLTPTDVAEGTIHQATIAVDGASIDVSYTVGAGETAEDVVDAFSTAITADPTVFAKVVPSKNGTLAAATLSLAPVAAGDQFSVSKLVEMSDVYAATEAAAAAINSLSAEDDDWYFYSTEDHTESWVMDTAAAIESLRKLYFVSTQEAGSITDLAVPATDTIGKLHELGYLRTAAFWHHTADTSFPECGFVGYNAPYDAGTVSWANLQISGVSAAQDPVSGNRLSSTQKGNLFDRNCNTTEAVAGLTISREGKLIKGNFIDDIRGSDDLDATMTADLQQLLASQKGTKLSYTDEGGILQLRSIMAGALQRFVDRGYITGYSLNTPSRADVSANDIAERDYSVATFEAPVAGAIHTVSVLGNIGI